MNWLINLMITSLIFFPESQFYEKPQDYNYDYEELSIQTEDNIALHGWFLRAPSEKAVILYFHGNGGNISNRLFKVKGWIDRGISVVLVDYRGYGKSQGKIKHEKDLVVDGQAVLDWAMNEKGFSLDEIIFYGESLGTHVAIQLATKHKVSSLILEAPYTSFVELGKLHYPLLPGAMTEMLMKDFSFANIDLVENVKSPTFLMHGTLDETCPFFMSETLFEKIPEPKGFFSIENGMHNDLPIKAGDDYWQKPFEFVSRYLK